MRIDIGSLILFFVWVKFFYSVFHIMFGFILFFIWVDKLSFGWVQFFYCVFHIVLGLRLFFVWVDKLSFYLTQVNVGRKLTNLQLNAIFNFTIILDMFVNFVTASCQHEVFLLQVLQLICWQGCIIISHFGESDIARSSSTYCNNCCRCKYCGLCAFRFTIQTQHFVLALLLWLRSNKHYLTLKCPLLFQATYYSGLCETTTQGGLGFDYFLNLSALKMWLSFLKNTPDHERSRSKVVIWLSDVNSTSDEILWFLCELSRNLLNLILSCRLSTH